MPRLKAAKDEDSGTYSTKGLSEAQFLMTFNRITNEQKENRRKGKRLLTPHALKRRSVADIARLGKKENGEDFTYDDIKRLEKIKTKYKKRRGSVQGINFREIIAKSRAIDIKRANNQVTDNSGITKASLIALRKGNIAFIRVKASKKSKHDEHLVKIRMDEWNDCLQAAKPTKEGYERAAKAACAGRVSFDCSCGRHQYWYRYIATLGNYQLSPPLEFVYPKLKNPRLQGICCKHVAKSITMMQSVAWQRPLAKQMELQSRLNGFGDDHIKNYWLTDDEKKAASKNRKLTVNQDQARAEYRKYRNRLSALSKKLKQNPELNKKRHEQLKKLRVKHAKAMDEIAKLTKENERLKAKQKLAAKRTANKADVMAKRDAMKLAANAVIDSFVYQGFTEKQAIEAYAASSKISVKDIEKLRKK